MFESGFIYVLINPSMEGLIKIGKTTRDPVERAEELSQVTGVPTPFIVAYQMPVDDCSRAEEFVHSYLESKRLSNNREFFEATLTDAINAILEYQREFDYVTESDDSYIDTPKNDNKRPWEQSELLAEEYYYGFGDYLQDYKKALSYYKQAVKLGSPSACERVGNMYELGEGCKADNELAMDYYKKGADRGNYKCYGNMMEIYFDQQHVDNALKCWDIYVQNTIPLSPSFCIKYVKNMWELNLPIKYIKEMSSSKDEILKLFTQMTDYIKMKNSDDIWLYSWLSERSRLLEYFEYILSNTDQPILDKQDYINEKMNEKMKKENAEIQRENQSLIIIIGILLLLGLIIGSSIYGFFRG